MEWYHYATEQNAPLQEVIEQVQQQAYQRAIDLAQKISDQHALLIGEDFLNGFYAGIDAYEAELIGLAEGEHE